MVESSEWIAKGKSYRISYEDTRGMIVMCTGCVWYLRVEVLMETLFLPDESN